MHTRSQTSPTHLLAHAPAFVHTYSWPPPFPQTLRTLPAPMHLLSLAPSQPNAFTHAHSLPQRALTHPYTRAFRHPQTHACTHPNAPVLMGSCHPHPSHNPADTPRPTTITVPITTAPHRTGRGGTEGSSSSRPPLGPMPSRCPLSPLPHHLPALPARRGQVSPPSPYLPQFLTSELFRELAGASSINQSPCG